MARLEQFHCDVASGSGRRRRRVGVWGVGGGRWRVGVGGRELQGCAKKGREGGGERGF